jgi:LysR family transcriptional regulator, hydrogen peroxide-inducible genes activator
MSLPQLEYIIALDNFRNFMRAADQCCITQPNLTIQVKKLEDELGVLIFDRQTFPIKPTEIGVQIIAQARQVIREASVLKELVNQNRQSIQGEYLIGIIPTLAPYLLPLFLKDFLAKYPEVRLRIEELQTAEIIYRLKHDLLHIGILTTPLEEANLREIPIFYEPLLLYIIPEHPLAQQNFIQAQDLSRQELLLLKEGHCFRNQVLNICSPHESNPEKQWHYESGSLETLKRMVEQNLGYTLVPELSVFEQLQDSKVKRFNAPEPTREISLVVHNSFSRELMLEKLHSEILSKIPASFQTKPLKARRK